MEQSKNDPPSASEEAGFSHNNETGDESDDGDDNDGDGKPTSMGSAQRHYLASGQSRKTLFLLCIGLKNLETGEPLFDIDVPPWTWIKRRSIKPSQAECCDEIKRRAQVIQERIPASVVPHPKNWTWTKCFEWMTLYPVEEYDDVQFLRAEVPRAAALGRDEEKEASSNSRSSEAAGSSVSAHAFSGKRKRLADFFEMKADGEIARNVAQPAPTPAAANVAPMLGSDHNAHSLAQAVGAFVTAYKEEGARQDRQAKRKRIEDLEDKGRDYRRMFVEHPDKFSIVAKFYKTEAEKMQQEANDLKASLYVRTPQFSHTAAL